MGSRRAGSWGVLAAYGGSPAGARGWGTVTDHATAAPQRATATLDHPGEPPLDPTMTEQPPAGFAKAWSLTQAVDGWMTQDQARRLWDAASRVPEGGQIVEIGSFRGRSHDRAGPGGRRPRDRSSPSTPTRATTGAPGDRGYEEHAAARPRGVPREPRAGRRRVTGCATCGRSPTMPTADVAGTIDLLYIDGAHRYRPAPGRHPRLGRPGRARRHDADPRLVQLGRRDRLAICASCSSAAGSATSVGPRR